MATTTWEKPHSTVAVQRPAFTSIKRLPFLLGAFAILAAVIFLISTSTIGGARYYITVDELLANPAYVGQTVRFSGAVVGDTINYDSQALIIEFEVANLPTGYTDLAVALHDAANNPDAQRVRIRVEGQVKPDLLQHEAEAIVSGQLRADGTFLATELLLKCPTRMEDGVPQQLAQSEG
jgi:cytochrome c-type biogenesis protein CcmE